MSATSKNHLDNYTSISQQPYLFDDLLSIKCKNAKKSVFTFQDVLFFSYFPTFDDPVPYNFKPKKEHPNSTASTEKSVFFNFFDYLCNNLEKTFFSKEQPVHHLDTFNVANFMQDSHYLSHKQFYNSTKSGPVTTINSIPTLDSQQEKNRGLGVKRSFLERWKKPNTLKDQKSNINPTNLSVAYTFDDHLSKNINVTTHQTISQSVSQSVLTDVHKHFNRNEFIKSAKKDGCVQIKEYTGYVSKSRIPEPLVPFYTILFQNYISSNSEYTLNISGSLKNLLTDMFTTKNLTYGMFDSVLECVLEMIYTNVYIPNISLKK
ncbi:hypothetical protein BB561_005450 [Smittium simulii]|uniref:RGS domain-containing protein n=1 Tax=Smittium simulii TaxID=133385 RepID=A0A2T9YAB8_9FUNG|nr:hypothetical protein BB561_005450 [Smittium simulii]